MNSTTATNQVWASNQVWAFTPSTKCPCGRQGTIRWGDALSRTHGFHTYRCERCAAREQLRHAVERALAIPGLVIRLLRAR